MASLPSQYPTLSIHLADLALTPLITSARSPSHLESLTSLASGALSAHTAAQRAQLGRPQRIMVEYPDAGPVVLQTYLDPCDAAGLVVAGVGPTPVLAAAGGAGAAAVDREPGPHRENRETAGVGSTATDGDENPARPEDAAPMLVGLVVAGSSDEARDARRAAARVERVGRQFQREWTAQGAAERAVEASAE